jgi:nitrous oxide reductase accessory protein NosL
VTRLSIRSAAALVCAIALGAAAASAAAPPGFVKPGKDEKCPVCGMFVYKYPDWVAELVFRDGSRAVFDGAKDLFRYFFDARRFGGTKGRGDVAVVFVTDYYTLEPIDGLPAFYVIGSDVYGPMGKELIPFERRADAEEFLRDHGGRRIIVFDEIERELGGLVE